MELPNLGELELELLRFITDHSPITVRDASIQFGEERELARTTVLTVMERLRKKGYLKRKSRKGVFEYSPYLKKSDLLKKLISSFADKVLGGSIDPLVAYLAEDADLSDEQISELQRLLEGKRKNKNEQRLH
ncbi:BlaI/MecI/CopY family transcriptional regulator [bacterium]|nr:BlaI/MecI/CopY family transcriptional regulator [bacterium]